MDRPPVKLAKTPDEKGAALNDLAIALSVLGERESGTARLQEAVTAYRAALEERSRDRVPLDWTVTQNNLGNALSILGERESDTALLEEAVTAYHEALQERPRDSVPRAWAMTQDNIGIALSILGELEDGTMRLEEAAFTFRKALEELPRAYVPLDRAKTQRNLANVEIALFDKTGAPEHLNAAEEHLSQVRQVFVQAGATKHVAIVDQNAAMIAARRA